MTTEEFLLLQERVSVDVKVPRERDIEEWCDAVMKGEPLDECS